MGVAVYNVVLAAVAAATLLIQRRKIPLRGLVGFAMATVGLASVMGYLFYRAEPLDPMFAGMRMVAYGVFVHTPILLLAWAWLDRRTRPRWSVGLGLVAVLLIAVGIDAFLIEPEALEVNEIELVSDALEEPITIAVLADIQTEMPSDYERRAIRAALAAKPDVILLPGDFVHASSLDSYARGMTALRQMFLQEKLQAPLGAYAVAGNVDTIDTWVTIFEGTGVETATVSRTLRPRSDVSVTSLTLEDSFDPQLAIAAQPGFHIVFGHGPDFALGDVKADLLVAGHTHGGQVRLPGLGALVTLSEVPRDWAAGATALSGGRTLVVSRGIGLERGYAPRLRFRCRPEVVIIRVEPSPSRVTSSRRSPSRAVSGPAATTGTSSPPPSAGSAS